MNFSQLFGKKGGKGENKKAHKKDNVEQTLLMLDQKINEQELRLNNLETKTNALQNEAKEKLKAGDKAGAKRLLAKKKKYIEQIKTLEGAMEMMEEQKMMLQNTAQMKDVMQAIINANEILKEATKGVNVEDLEQMREDMDNIKADQEELNNFFKDYTEENLEDVNEEFEELEKQMAQDNIGSLPQAPKEKLYPQKAKNKEEDALNSFLSG